MRRRIAAVLRRPRYASLGRHALPPDDLPMQEYASLILGDNPCICSGCCSSEAARLALDWLLRAIADREVTTLADALDRLDVELRVEMLSEYRRTW